jgi:cobyrinic acid a,c-diamide synthase
MNGKIIMDDHTIPAFLVAGTHSGVGKTTVVLGLMAAFRERGLKVQPFKVGPDFIDPSHHTTICGRASRNLDTFMMGVDGVRRSFAGACAGADVAIVEGVMGLFDGMDATEVASSAHVAKALDIPVVLVINVHGMSRSAAALVQGFQSFDPDVKIAGVILNRVGSEKHLAALRGSIKLPIIGAIPRKKEISLPSRHLGLQMAFESNHNVRALSDLLERNSDLQKLLEMRAKVPTIELMQDAGTAGKTSVQKDVRIGIAMDEAFCFYYQDNIDSLKANGAAIVPFSPINDEMPEVDGLYIGGGYPELHADELSEAPALPSIKNAAMDGMPIYGECGGLMYLSKSVLIDERKYKMCGVLPAETVMTSKLQALGYVIGNAARPNPLTDIGSEVRGHEFHYSRIEPEADSKYAYKFSRGRGIADGNDGMVEHNTLGAYLHAHFSTMQTKRFIDSCRRYARR